MAEGSLKCAQVTLTILNILQFLLGVVLIIVGALAMSKSVDSDQPMDSKSSAIYLLAIGCILVVISIVGCIGAWSKNYCLLIVYCIFVTLIFILLLVCLIVAFVFKGKVRGVFDEWYFNEIKNASSSIQTVQEKLECCGLYNYTDWAVIPKYNNSHSAPGSCCKMDWNDVCPVDKIFEKACGNLLVGSVEIAFLGIGVAAAVCAVLMLLATILSACLAHSIKGEYHAV